MTWFNWREQFAVEWNFYVFKAKKQGTASIVFSDATVRLNDGLGTDVLSRKDSANITIIDSPKDNDTVTVPQQTTTIGGFDILKVSSKTNWGWYSCQIV